MLSLGHSGWVSSPGPLPSPYLPDNPPLEAVVTLALKVLFVYFGVLVFTEYSKVLSTETTGALARESSGCAFACECVTSEGLSPNLLLSPRSWSCLLFANLHSCFLQSRMPTGVWVKGGQSQQVTWSLLSHPGWCWLSRALWHQETRSVRQG